MTRIEFKILTSIDRIVACESICKMIGLRIDS